MMNVALKAKAAIKMMFSQMKRRKRLQMKTFRPKTVVTMTTTNNPKK